jgi:hypothetical protein
MHFVLSVCVASRFLRTSVLSYPALTTLRLVGQLDGTGSRSGFGFCEGVSVCKAEGIAGDRRWDVINKDTKSYLLFSLSE